MATERMDRRTLMRMIEGFRVTQMLHVAVTLGLADLVADGPKSAPELAARTGTHAGALYRLLRGLAAHGVFAEDARGRFGPTRLSALLRPTTPGSVYGWNRLVGHPQMWQPWGELLHSVRTGEPAFPKVYGTSVWEYRKAHPEANTIFNEAMTGQSAARNREILDAYDFAGISTLVDVGGGHGELLGSVLQTYPEMRGILFDQPHVVAGAPPHLERLGVADRCAVAEGDFFEAVPPGGDAYVLSKIIHDWSDTPATVILTVCRRAMDGRGRLLLVECVLQSPGRPIPDNLIRMTLMDLNMLVMTSGGCERTEEEFRTLLAAAGFELTRIVPTRGENSVIEARPA